MPLWCAFLFIFRSTQTKQISAGNVADVADVGKKDCNGGIQWHTNESPFGE
jgi:hypothetical protein